MRVVVNLIQGRRDLEIISISASFLGQDWIIGVTTDYRTKDYGVGLDFRFLPCWCGLRPNLLLAYCARIPPFSD